MMDLILFGEYTDPTHKLALDLSGGILRRWHRLRHCKAH